MRLTLVLIATLCCSVGSVSAQMSESEGRQACTGDALRLCSAFIPDRDKIRQCLASKRAELSPACATVMDAAASRTRRRDGGRQN